MRPIKKSKIILARLADSVGSILFLFRKRHNQPINPSEIHSILVLELFNIGDVIMSLPAIYALRQIFPSAKITFLGSSWSQVLLSNTKQIDEFITTSVPWVENSASYKQTWNFAKQLRPRKFDLAIDLRGDFRNIVFMYLTKAKERIASPSTGGGFLLTRLVPDNPLVKHDVDCKIAIIETLGIIPNKPELKLLLSQKDQDMTWKDLSAQGIQKSDILIGIHPGGRWAVKRWRPERFAKVIQSISKHPNIKFILFGGGSDKEIISNIVSQSGIPCLQLYPPLHLLPAYISWCNLFLCNDSGPMHIATAVDTPVIALFRPGFSEYYGPYGNQHQVLSANDMDCQSCNDQTCAHPDNWCMDKITVEQVTQILEKKISDIQGKIH